MSFRQPDPQAPLGSDLRPIHQSDYAPIMGGPDYTPPGGGVWAKTVGGTAFHNRMADVCNGAQRRPALYYVDEALKRERKVAWGRYTPESLAMWVEECCVATDNVFRPRREDGWVAEICFRYQDAETGYWYEGTIDLLNLSFDGGRIKSASIIDYKTGETLPDLRLGPQHHEYSLAVKYGVLDHVPYFEDTRLLDWSKMTALPLIPRKWPKEFRFLHVPALLKRGSWFALGMGSDGDPMTEADSLATMRALTKRLLENQPTRLAVAIPAEPQPENEMGNPQTTAIIPAQNHKVALEVSENIDVFQLGEVFSKSKFFKDCADANQAVVKILAGRELGLPPFQSMSGIHVIQGKATMGATLIAARIKGSGKYDYTVNQMADTKCEVEFFELRDGKRISIGKSEFSDADARKAGTQNMGKFPRNMLFARAISNGAKWFTPDIFGGPIYVPEEMQQDEPAEPIKSVAVEVAPAPEQHAAPQMLPTIPGKTETFPQNQPANAEQLKHANSGGLIGSQFTWGEPRGEGFASDAQIKRLKANCAAMGVGESKCLSRIIQLAGEFGTTGIASVAEIPFPVATRIVIKVEEALKAKGIPRPEREKTEAERVDEQVRQIVGELRTKRAKELADLVRSGPLSATEIIDIMANDAAPDTQFSVLAEEQQEQVLHTIKRAAQAAADRVALAANGNGHH